MRHWNRKGMQPILTEFEYDGVVMLKFPLLEQTGMIVQGFSTRIGGVSGGDCATMNFSYAQGDEPENVKENIRRFVTAMGCCPEQTVMSQQTHTVNVRVVTEKDAGKGYLRERDYTDVDGLITNVPGLVLLTTYADCVPLYFVDPVHRAIGLSHTGWRGTVAQMAVHTLHAMHREYGTVPEDVYAAIGPSICQDCYEVSEDVAQQVRSAFPSASWPMLLSKHGDGDGRYQLNLWNANRDLLIRAVVSPKRIEVTDICTCCNADKLHSHRRTGGKRGALAAFLCIKEQK